MKRNAYFLLVALGVVWGLGTAATGAAAEDSGKIVIDGSTTVGPVAKAFAEYYMRTNPGVNVTVSESGSGNGAKSLINGTCDIADMSRFMKDNEWKAASEKGVMPVAHVVAMDGIAMVVHPSNPVNEITMQQIHGIYAGRITNWSQLGGPNVKIVKITRDTNSGTYECFVELCMKADKIAPGTETLGSNGAVRDRVGSTPAAIGYVGMGFVDRTVKALVVDGVRPEPATVVSGKYPIARPLFMFTNGYPKLGSHVHRFVTLYLTKKGQEIVQEKGFVPLTNY